MPPKRKRGMEDIIQSRIIKFIIDEDEVECNVHEATIANLSEPLRALVTNGMKESVEGKVVWKDVDLDTFTKLMQYSYEHDFSIIDKEEELGDGSVLSLKECVDQNMLSGVYVYKLAEQYFFNEDDINQTVHHSHNHYMSHARLYILADCYAIYGLMALSIQKVRRMLVNNPIDDDLLATVWMLLECIWPKTSSEDMLRELLLRYLLVHLQRAMDSRQAAAASERTPEIFAALMLLAPQGHWAKISIY
ncbi:hypothetical protein ColTof4_02755 [Colletotrichum tofieldiae]|uniref:BTB domain-containing protein n=1 Tax=Colletotrichum tofieldiae TaxID=708197 RepID=A0A166X9S4_9PEZI|nr:hypothetical protein CT0861_03431 [Colletotrichum tofieldiae]GKT61610.1 hypothetical protein ColTof3_08949 [Colletotrichum tofieldiae]GKT70332.1 hypothetical protein ColTof4_02755 [Colletotrichum tofieldiae]GKT93391.1 hypothetical protein Ct61P_11241 [Colletotrichum tofieldiae]